MKPTWMETHLSNNVWQEFFWGKLGMKPTYPMMFAKIGMKTP
jgi:hypothetical protein